MAVAAVRPVGQAPTPTLKAYPCTQWNERLKKPCDATVIDAWAPGGAIIRRKCGVCGNWNLIRVEPSVSPDSI